MRGLEHHVPDGWKLTTFDALKAPGNYTFVGGPFGSTLTASDYVGAGVPVIRGNNLDGKNSRFIDDNFAFVTEDKADQLHRNLAFPGDLIFTQRGTLGQVGIIPDEAVYPRYVVSQSQMKLTPHPALLHPRFAYYYFRSHLADAYLRHRVLATGVPHINLGILKEFPVLLPPLPEQRRIADILDKADAIRRKRQEAVKLADEFLRSAFLEMFGDPVTNPKGWPVMKLANELEFVTSGSRGWAEYYSPTGALFLRIQNVGENRLLLNDIARVQAPDSAEARRTRVQPGDVLLSITADLGRTAVVPSDLGVAHINQHLAILRLRSLEPLYVSAFLASVGGQRQFNRLNREGVKAGLNFDDIRSVEILAPPPSDQRAFVSIYERHASSLKVAAAAAEGSSALFDSLVQRAFRGEL